MVSRKGEEMRGTWGEKNFRKNVKRALAAMKSVVHEPSRARIYGPNIEKDLDAAYAHLMALAEAEAWIDTGNGTAG
jgi:hypothetical protein